MTPPGPCVLHLHSSIFPTFFSFLFFHLAIHHDTEASSKLAIQRAALRLMARLIILLALLVVAAGVAGSLADKPSHVAHYNQDSGLTVFINGTVEYRGVISPGSGRGFESGKMDYGVSRSRVLSTGSPMHCGPKNSFIGEQSFPAARNYTVQLLLSGETLCKRLAKQHNSLNPEEWANRTLLWNPAKLWQEATDLEYGHLVRASFPCIDFDQPAEAKTAFEKSEHFVLKHGFAGYIAKIRLVNALGRFSYWDSLGYYSATAHVGKPYKYLECAVQASAQALWLNSDATMVEIAQAELAFKSLFDSWLYHLVFRWFFGLLFLAISCQAFTKAYQCHLHVRNCLIQKIILCITGVTCMDIGIIQHLLTCIMADSLRAPSSWQSWLVLQHLGPALSCLYLIALIWREFVTNHLTKLCTWINPSTSMRNNLPWYHYIVPVIFTSSDLIVGLKTTDVDFQISMVQIPLVVLYTVFELITVCFFAKYYHKFFQIVCQSVQHEQDPMLAYKIKLALWKARRLGISLLLSVVASLLLGTPFIYLADYFPYINSFIATARALLSIATIKLASAAYDAKTKQTRSINPKP